MALLPAQYHGLRPQDLQRHFIHLADSLPDRGFIEVACADFVIPCQKKDYKKKETKIFIRFRVSDFGRPLLDRLFEVFSEQDYDLKVRRSAKLKLMSQFSIGLPVSDTLPIVAVAVLRTLCDNCDITWPTKFICAYVADQFDPDLPGEFTMDSPFWRAGHTLGKVAGNIMRKLLNS